MRPLTRVLVLLVTIVPSWLCAQNELRVFISADMEGISGAVSSGQLRPEGFEYERFRNLMTDEVNAAIDGALSAGATKITVADSHGNALNLVPDRLNPKARLVRGWPRPLQMMEGIDQGFDAALLVGYHASSNTEDAVRAHTISSGRYFDVQLNGKHASEAMISAAIAGHFGVPVVFVSGDEATVQEVRKTIGPDIVGAVVKRSIGFHAAENLSPADTKPIIREAVVKALQERGAVAAYVLKPPIKLRVTFKNQLNAEILSYLPIVERVDGSTIEYTAPDVPQAVRFLSFISEYDSNQ